MKKLLTIAVVLFMAMTISAQTRQSVSMDEGWRFSNAQQTNAEQVEFDDSSWRGLDVPHDWSIEGRYNRYNTTGRGGGYLPSGIGWYRKTFSAPESLKGQRIFIEFDGVMENSSVYLNGKLLGTRPNGYVSFAYDMTDLLNYGESNNNTLVVKVDNSVQPSSRWYTGAGIYRHVRMVAKSSVAIPQWGVFITTPQANAKSAQVKVQTSVENKTAQKKTVTIVNQVIDKDGRIVKSASSQLSIAPQTIETNTQNITVANPKLWDTENPNMYTLQTKIMEGKKVFDDVVSDFGIRTIRYDAEKGFFLNEEPLKMYGVCLHHDGAAVGAAVPLAVWEYRFDLLKEAGVNAIRTAHNPMSPEFLDLCDRMGFLVMNETFDTWEAAKNHAQNGYNLHFKKWWKADTRDVIMRDRNHPSIVLVSVGNEIRDNLNTPEGFKKYKDQQDLVHQYDGTRPVTMALFRPNESKVYSNGFVETMDVVGQNYRPKEIVAAHIQNPKRIVIGTENIHDVETWLTLRDNEFMCGQFLWTGFDYLGEAQWPNIGYSGGLFDKIGDWKREGLQRQSWWSKKPVVYAVRKSDNNGAGAWVRDWTPIDFDTYDQAVIEVYSNTEEVELFVNNESKGVVKMPANAQPAKYTVSFKKGELRVEGKNGGKTVASEILKTAGAPAKILLTASKSNLKKNFDDVAYIKATIVDENGLRCPDADHLIQFSVEGAGKIIATDNGDLTCKESYIAPEHSAYQGVCAAIVRATENLGKFTIKASAEGISQSGTIEIEIK